MTDAPTPMPDETEFHVVAREKMTRVLGTGLGLRLLSEILARQENDLATADDLHRFATELARRPAFEGAVGGMLQVTALMRGASPGRS